MKNITCLLPLLFFIALPLFCDAQQPSWKPLGPDTGRLASMNKPNDQSTIATNAFGIPYVAYTETWNSARIRIKKFKDSAWIDVGIPDYQFKGYYPVLTISPNDTLYVCYRRTQDSTVKVIKFDGTNWNFVGTPYKTSPQLFELSIAVDSNEKPYVGYGVFSLGDSVANIISFDGTNWTPVGNTSFMHKTDRISIRTGINNQLYAAYNTGTSASYVQKWDGTNWDTVGQTFTYIYNMDIAPDGTPFIAYWEFPGTSQIRVAKLVNNVWIMVGVTQHFGHSDYFDEMAIDEAGVPYIAFSDNSCPLGSGALNATILKYNGSNWSQVGKPCFSLFPARDTRMAFGKGIPYMTYSTTSNLTQLYAMYFDTSTVVAVPETIVAQNSFSVSPNPATSTITLQTTQSGSFSITDMLGRTLLSQSVTDAKTTLFIAHLPAGVYAYRFIAKGGGSANGKLFINP